MSILGTVRISGTGHRKFFTVLILVFSVASLFAADVSFGVNLDGGYANLGKFSAFSDAFQNGTRLYSASPWAQISYSDKTVRAELRFSYSVSGSYVNSSFSPLSSQFSLDKAYIRFRLPSFGGSRLGITAGKAPVSWGMGQYFRAGDILFDTPLSNEQAGTNDENRLWILGLSQPLGGGFTVDAAFVPYTGSGKAEKAGIMLGKDFKSDVFKELRAAYVYTVNGGHRLSVLADLNLFADINIGVETSFDDIKGLADYRNLRIVCNVFYGTSIETETSSHALNFYVSNENTFNTDTYKLMECVSLGLTDRTSLSVMETNTWEGGAFSLAAAVYTETVLADGLKLYLLGSYGYGFRSEVSAFTLGARLKYSI